MSIDISTLSYTLRKISAASPTPIGLGHAQQLVTAVLGFKSLAAYQAAVARSDERPHLDDVRHAVLNLPMLTTRASDLAVGVPEPELLPLVKAALEQCLPLASFHLSADKFEDAIRVYVDDRVLNDERTSGELASTNGDGIDEIYVPFDFSMVEMPSPGDVWEFELQGHVSVNIDTERPYSGHKVGVEARLTLERMGLATFGEALCKVTHAKLNYGWSDNDQDDSPKISLAQALSAEMGITVVEAEDLADAEPVPRTGNDGMVYGYIFDFTSFAPPAIAKKILKKYPSLQVEVPLWFFDQVVVTS